MSECGCACCNGAAEEAMVVEEPGLEAAAESIADADVEIARIGADRDIKVAKISAGVDRAEIDSEIEVLRGEIRGMREILDRIAPVPEPEPEPVIVEAPPVAEPEMEMSPKDAGHEPRQKSVKRGFF